MLSYGPRITTKDVSRLYLLISTEDTSSEEHILVSVVIPGPFVLCISVASTRRPAHKWEADIRCPAVLRDNVVVFTETDVSIRLNTRSESVHGKLMAQGEKTNPRPSPRGLLRITFVVLSPGGTKFDPSSLRIFPRFRARAQARFSNLRIASRRAFQTARGEHANSSCI